MTWQSYLLFTAAVIVLLLRSLTTAGFLPVTLTVERSLPTRGVNISELKARDFARAKTHNRRLLSAGVVDFPVDGSADPFTVGLYYTRVKLGNPEKEFYVQIDTGSDILWVTCNPCNNCPTSSGLKLQLESFDPSASSTASTISCSDSKCTSAMQTGEGHCSSSDSSGQCSYTFTYGDGSGSSGYYVSDTMHFDTITKTGQSANSSATILFGCSNNQTGDLTKSDRAIDGIFGFGPNELSVISQLSAAGVSPQVFSHCLKGSDNGGGIWVLGEIVEPGIVYTPLVPAQPHYYVNLQNIALNGKQLNIDSSVFSTSSTQGTIVDTGTTLTYLAESIYDTFVNGITSAVTSQVQSIIFQGSQCYLTATNSNVDDEFPTVTLNFANNAAITLKPEDYLLQQGTSDNSFMWCLGWQKNQGGMTILGDLVLKDKIFVYDLGNQRIGWVDYDCSQSVNVSDSTSKSYVNTRQMDVSGSSSRQSFFGLLPMGIAILLVHIFAFPVDRL